MAEIRVNATGALKLYDNDDSHFVGLQAGSVSSNVTFTLPTADGSNGQVLTTNGSGALSFATASSADPTSADGDSLGTASAEWSDLYLADGGIIYFGNDQDVTLTHVADTGLTLNGTFTTANSMLINGTTPTLTIGDAGAEDTKVVFDGNAQDYHIGLDDSADDLVIGKGSALGTTTHMSFDENGVITMPLQPMCMVVGQTDATQTITNQTLTTLVFDTENYDIGGNFNTGDYTFTAPVAGKYLCHLSVSFNAGQIATNTRNFMGIYVGGSAVNQNFGSTTGSNDRLSLYQTVILDLAASNTLTGRIYIDNGANADVWMNSGGIDFTYMSIAKIG